MKLVAKAGAKRAAQTAIPCGSATRQDQPPLLSRLLSRLLCKIGCHDWRDMNAKCRECGARDWMQ